MKFEVFGKEVSREVYEQIQTRRVTLVDREIPAESLQFWATSKEIAEELPDYAAEAKRLRGEIMEEFHISAGPEGNRTVLEKYFSEVRDLAEKNILAVCALYEAEDKAGKAVNVAGDDDTRARAKVAAMDATAARREGVEKIQKEQAEKIDAIRSSVAADLDAFYTPDPRKLDAGTVQLIETGILDPDELAGMAEKFRDNATMLRVIDKYCTDTADRLPKANKARNGFLNIHAELNGRPGIEMKLFDRLASKAGSVIDGRNMAAAVKDLDVMFANCMEDLNTAARAPRCR